MNVHLDYRQEADVNPSIQLQSSTAWDASRLQSGLPLSRTRDSPCFTDLWFFFQTKVWFSFFEKPEVFFLFAKCLTKHQGTNTVWTTVRLMCVQGRPQAFSWGCSQEIDRRVIPLPQLMGEIVTDTVTSSTHKCLSRTRSKHKAWTDTAVNTPGVRPTSSWRGICTDMSSQVVCNNGAQPPGVSARCLL